MSIPSKASTLQAYNMLLYRTALHPEFFEIAGRTRIDHGDYEFEAWLFPGGHLARFEHSGVCVTEVVTESGDSLPTRGLMTTFPCAGEKDHESEFGEDLLYITSIQTEMLPDHLFSGTYSELKRHAESGESMYEHWSDEIGNNNLSLVDVQRFSNQVHLQSYHLRQDCKLVLRTQTIFEIKA